MRKSIKILMFFSLMFFVGFYSLKVSGYDQSWEYFPRGVNYIDPTNLNASGEYPYYQFFNINPFKIKPTTTYSLFSTYPNEDYIIDYEFNFYDENKNQIPSNLNLRFTYDNDNNITGITFDTPDNSSYIYLYIFFYHNLPGDFVILEQLDYNFIFCEGDIHPGLLSLYQGPDDDIRPVLEGQTGYYYTNIDNPITVSEIQAGLIATDDVDGDITANITVFEDNYTANMNTIGVYSIIFRVSDSSGNTTDFTVYVEVVDNISPVISGPYLFITSPLELISTETIKNQLTVTDNYDTILQLQVEIDNYTINYNILGVYTIVFSTTDSSNNYSSYTVSVSVEDNVAPIIAGPSNMTKPNNVDMSITEILAQYTATDDVDGILTSRIVIETDNYSLNQNKVGNWTVLFSVIDNSNNKATTTLTVQVIDKTPPVFLIDRSIITIDLRENNIQVYDMIKVLQKTDVISENAIVEVVYDEYTENKKTPGTYKVVLEAEDKEFELEVRVVEGLYEDIQEKVGKDNFFITIFNFIKKIFSILINFFKNLF